MGMGTPLLPTPRCLVASGLSTPVFRSIRVLTTPLSGCARSTVAVCIVLSTATDSDGLGARFTLDVAAPIVLAVTVVTNDYSLHRVASTTAHRLATFCAARVFFAHPVYMQHTHLIQQTTPCHMMCIAPNPLDTFPRNFTADGEVGNKSL